MKSSRRQFFSLAAGIIGAAFVSLSKSAVAATKPANPGPGKAFQFLWNENGMVEMITDDGAKTVIIGLHKCVS